MPVETDGKNPVQTTEPKHIGGSFLLWLIVLMFINSVFWAEPSDKQVAYSTFVSQVEAGKVIHASIGTEKIKYELKADANIKQSKTQPKQIYITKPIPNDTELPKILREHQVEYSASESDSAGWISVLLSWVIPPLIFFSILGFMFNRSGMGNPAALTIGKSKARIYAEGSTGVTFDDVAGVDEAKAEVQEIVDFLQNPTKYAQVSTGASDDIQKATDLAERFVTLYGMSAKLGPVAFEKIQQQFLNSLTNPRRAISEKISEQIDQEVKEIIDGAHKLALIILKENQGLLEEVAHLLLEKEVLEGEELRAYLLQVKLPRNMNEWLHTGKFSSDNLFIVTTCNGHQKYTKQVVD